MSSESYGLIGVDTSEVSSTATFGVGQYSYGDDNAGYVYVKFTGIVSGASRAVTVDESWNAIQATQAGLADGHKVGVSLHTTPNTANQYGWVQIKGVAQAYVESGGAADSLLGVSGTSGIFATVASASTAFGLLGAVNAAAGSGTTAAKEVILNFPHWNGYAA